MSVKLLSLANLGVFLKIEGEFLTVVSGTAPGGPAGNRPSALCVSRHIDARRDWLHYVGALGN